MNADKVIMLGDIGVAPTILSGVGFLQVNK